MLDSGEYLLCQEPNTKISIALQKTITPSEKHWPMDIGKKRKPTKSNILFKT
jgi:hypothetical protein